jgi:hypothetical protein
MSRLSSGILEACFAIALADYLLFFPWVVHALQCRFTFPIEPLASRAAAGRGLSLRQNGAQNANSTCSAFAAVETLEYQSVASTNPKITIPQFRSGIDRVVENGRVNCIYRGFLWRRVSGLSRAQVYPPSAAFQEPGADQVLLWQLVCIR